ncbi:MAG: hypothetical protein KAQ93_01105 [Spirochaetales bacterium]|nr:hypothetical protein [Spirochaetales bacterium]
MSENQESGEKTNTSRNRRRNNYRRSRIKRSFPECPICHKSVKFLLTAMSVGEDNKPAHFDCVLKQVTDSEELGPKEKIIYIGNGNFAIINGKTGKDLSIRKTIQFEEKESNGEWRKKLSRNLKNR